MLVVAILAMLAAQQPDDDRDLPVSLARIRAALEAPDSRLRIATDRPADFTVHIRERHLDDGILQRLDFRSGPVPPGGLYAYEQRQRLGQAYAQQPLVSIDLLALAHAISHGVRESRRAAAEIAAR